MSARRAVVKGSEKFAVSGAVEIGSIDKHEMIELAVILRPNPHTLRSLNQMIDSLAAKFHRDRSYISRPEFEAMSLGIDEDDVRLLRQFVRDSGVKIVSVYGARRTIMLSGEYECVSELFGVQMKRYLHPKENKRFRGRTGPVFVPLELAEVIQAVMGFDDRPQSKTHFRPLLPGQATISSYTPIEVANLYNFPLTEDGSGESIGIIELGGGFDQQDLETYFSNLGIKTPHIVAVSVDGGTNSPTGDQNGPDGEVMLDIEVAGSIAPSAQIVVYFAPNTDKGFLDAVSTAIHDQTYKPSVISISWGSAENTWTAQAVQAFNQVFKDASTMGVTVCVASGDNGSSDGQIDGLAHVDFPASSPFVLGCGGTTLMTTGQTIREVVWNEESSGGGATGGGVSNVFALPVWQQKMGVPPSANPGGHIGRGVPDVSGDADPRTGYQVIVDGQKAVFGGTSAVAPLWSSLLTLLAQKLHKAIGYANPLFYQKLVTIKSGTEIERGFDDVIEGNNGAYKAKAGWDACTGLGSPEGSKLLSLL